MRRLFVACATLLACTACTAPVDTAITASATTTSANAAVAYTQLNSSDYQSFVKNWTPEEDAFCGAFGSVADWSAVMHPAATMGSHTYAPPDSLWAGHAVLMLARVAPSGDAVHVFQVNAVRRTQDGIEVDYTFTSPPPASSTEKYYFAISVAKPLAGRIRFITNGHDACDAELGAAHTGPG